LEDDEEVANFVRILNKGTNDRYKGKLPLIFFNCDGIGHFANKCPHNKNKRNDEDYLNRKQTYKKKKKKKRNLSRKSYAPKNTSPHQMKIKSVTVRHK
jgi:hypothetical protein